MTGSGVSKYQGVHHDYIAERIERNQVWEFGLERSVANAGATADILVRTGSSNVELWYRAVETNGDNIEYVAYQNPTVTLDGTPVTIYPVNKILGEIDGAGFTVFDGPTVSNIGTQTIPVINLYGEAGIGERKVAAFARDPFKKQLPGNSEFIVRVTNNGTVNPANIDIHMVFIEVEGS